MKSYKGSKVIALVIAAALVLTLLAAGCGGGGSKPAEPAKTAAPVKWVANSVWPPANHQSVGLTEFAKRAKELAKKKKKRL